MILTFISINLSTVIKYMYKNNGGILMKITILDGSAANPGDLSFAPFEEFGEVMAYDVTKPGQLIERMRGSEVAITNKTVFDRETLEALPDLRYIGVLATGYNVVDLDECRKRGITVTNVPEYGTYATAQMTIALLLELTNHTALHDSSVKAGDWVRSEQFCYWKKPLTELYGKKAVIVGYGKIGKRVCAILEALGAEVIAVPHTLREGVTHDGNVRFMSFEEAVPMADILSFHCPLTDETRGMISRKNFASCKKGVIVINAARGPIAVESDVRGMLEEGIIGGYAADVVSQEPMLPDNPLLGAPNCILTPHIAWAAKETRMRLIEVAADNLRAYLNGSPVNTVT